MPIELRQPGESALYAGAGQIIGKAERAKEERARTERQQEQSQQIAAQQAARQMAQEWEIQKMLLNSQQDFAHEQRLRQADLDGEARAKEWEYEKMELRSRFDLEQDEKERIRDKAEYISGRDALKKNENLTEKQQADAIFVLSIKHPDVTEAAAELGKYPEYIQRLQGITPLTPKQQFESKIYQPLLDKVNAESAAKISGTLTTGAVAGQPRTEKLAIQSIVDAGDYAVRDKATGAIAPVPAQDLADTLATNKYELVKAPREKQRIPNPYLAYAKAPTAAQKGWIENMMQSILGPDYRERSKPEGNW